MSSSIIIQKLILVGFRKNYEISFNEGVNIIYGDSDTGKSSILEFINYLLGHSSIELADEMKGAVDYATLELCINDVPYTIKRNIYKFKEFIEVYPCTFDECPNYVPEKYSPNFNITTAPNGFYSDFLLDSLNFPKVKIKVAPTQTDSATKRLSFRNLFKFCYINQDDVGSKSFLDIGNWVKFVTNKEVFKYIFNVLDSSITELEVEISDKSQKRTAEKQKHKAVSDFLMETDYESLVGLDESIDDIDQEIITFESELEKLNSTMVSDSENYDQLKSIFNELTLSLKKITSNIQLTQDNTDKYTRLKHDYENDISKIKGIQVARERMGSEVDALSSCPICESSYQIDTDKMAFEITPLETLDEELNSLMKRKKNISQLLTSQTEKYKSYLKEKLLYEEDLTKARDMLDTESQEMITPYLLQRDSIIKEIASLKERRGGYVNNLKIRNQQDKIYRSYQKLDSAIEKLNDRLKTLKKEAPQIDSVIKKYSTLIFNFFTFINIKNRTAIRISERNYTPIVRGKEYSKITSGGLRTITSIGYMISLMKYSIEHEINYPNLLLIDTVGKYIGKTSKNQNLVDTDRGEDAKEGLSDPVKYKNLYESIIDVATFAQEKNKKCQFILVDNDVPTEFVERYKSFIVAHYDSTGADGLKVGLIDDAKVLVKDQ